MPDRVPSDHESVETRRVTVARVGRTDRPRVELPDDLDPSEGDVVRVSLAGDEGHARVETTLDGEPVLRRVVDNARLAREEAGENRLAEWVGDAAVALGGSVHLDVVTPGYKYGLRPPGERVVYDATSAPDSSLANIARDLEE